MKCKGVNSFVSWEVPMTTNFRLFFSADTQKGWFYYEAFNDPANQFPTDPVYDGYLPPCICGRCLR